MKGPKGLGGASASTCFLCHCRLEILNWTMIDVNGCEGLTHFLLMEGLLPSRPLLRTEENVCRCCLSDLWQLQELLNKEKELRKQMSQTVGLIKGRVQDQESGQSAEAAGQAEDREGEYSEEGDSDIQLEVLSTYSENGDADVGAGAIGESEEEQEDSDEDDDEDASSIEPSSSSSEEDDDDDDYRRVSPPSKPNARTKLSRGVTATKAGQRSEKKKSPKGGPYHCEVAGQDEDPEGEDSQELLSENEERDAVPVRTAGRRRSIKAKEKRKRSDGESVGEGDARMRESSSSSDEDDDDYRTSPPSKSKPRATATATATATKAGQRPRKKRGPKGGPHPCEVSGCRALLENKVELYKHFLHAHNHRPFRCHEPSCNAAYSYPNHLNEHMASTHENKGRRPFRCDVEGCGKRFPSALYLQGHRYKVHSGKAVRTCGICGKKLTTPNNLVKHMRRFHARRNQKKEKGGGRS